MKRYAITAVLVLATITVFAQTSRRQSNVKSGSTASVAQRENTSNSSRRNYESKSNRSNTDNKSSSEISSRRPGTTSVTTRRSNNSTNVNPVNRENTSVSRKDKPVYHDRSSHERPTTVHVHQNNRPVKRDYEVRRYTTPRTHVRVYRNDYRPVRHVNYVRSHYYHAPRYHKIYWTVDMYHDFRILYPFVKVWYMPVGTAIHTIPAYEAEYHVGDIKRIYGRVTEVYYSPETDEYHLYLGNSFPFQDFTVIIPGGLARDYSRRPGRYFYNENILVTGFITEYNGSPEIVVKRNYQLSIY